MDKPVIIVTGTSSGIGRDCVAHLVKNGAHVVATARKVADITDLAAPDVTTMQLDVVDEQSRTKLVSDVLAKFGRIDGLVNNAGYGATVAVEDTTPQMMQQMFDVNLFGLHELTRLVLPQMRKQGSGRIVNVASIAGHVAIPGFGAYCATKFALVGYTQALAQEVRGQGIRACLIEPGVIKTKFGERSNKETDATVPDGTAYPQLYKRWNRMRMIEGGAPPRVISRRIVHACMANSPRFHYFAPIDSKAARFGVWLLPSSFINFVVRAYFGARRKD